MAEHTWGDWNTDTASSENINIVGDTFELGVNNVLQWRITGNDKGEGSLTDSVGSHDANVAGATVTSDPECVDGYRLDTGVDSAAQISSRDADVVPEISADRNWSVAVTVYKPDDGTTSDQVIWNRHPRNPSVTYVVGIRNGNINAGYYNDGWQATTGHIEPTRPYRKRIVTTYNSENGNIELYLNTNSSTEAGVDGSSGTLSDVGSCFTIAARDGTSNSSTFSPTDEFEGWVDNVIVSDYEWSNDKIQDDYNAQPWS